MSGSPARAWQFHSFIGVNPLQTTWPKRGIVSGRVALLPRSAEIQPPFHRFSDWTSPKANHPTPSTHNTDGGRSRAPRYGSVSSLAPRVDILLGGTGQGAPGFGHLGRASRSDPGPPCKAAASAQLGTRYPSRIWSAAHRSAKRRRRARPPPHPNHLLGTIMPVQDGRDHRAPARIMAHLPHSGAAATCGLHQTRRSTSPATAPPRTAPAADRMCPRPGS